MKGKQHYGFFHHTSFGEQSCSQHFRDLCHCIRSPRTSKDFCVGLLLAELLERHRVDIFLLYGYVCLLLTYIALIVMGSDYFLFLNSLHRNDWRGPNSHHILRVRRGIPALLEDLQPHVEWLIIPAGYGEATRGAPGEWAIHSRFNTVRSTSIIIEKLLKI